MAMPASRACRKKNQRRRKSGNRNGRCSSRARSPDRKGIGESGEHPGLPLCVRMLPIRLEVAWKPAAEITMLSEAEIDLWVSILPALLTLFPQKDQ